MIFKPSEICDFNLDFHAKCLEIYQWQLKSNDWYSDYCRNLEHIGVLDIGSILSVDQIPLVPIEVFRDNKQGLVYKESQAVFRSSGTTGIVRSEHSVPFINMYSYSIWKGLKYFYPIEDFVYLGYTPGYDQNPDSSLIWMINYMISQDTSGLSRFLKIGEPISQTLLEKIQKTGKRAMLFGAAFGLIDLIEAYPHKLPENSIIMETGGMKTFRKEMNREDLHNQLATGFGVSLQNVHSEYGMTELLSQAYSLGTEWFETPPWMKVSIRNPENPAEILPYGEHGLIGVIDLANWATEPFLLTGDRGVQQENGQFKVLGRWNAYFLRGCNFLLEQD